MGYRKLESPWVKNFTIKQEKKINKSTYTYTIEFNLSSSTGNEGKESATLNVKRVHDNWYIDKVTFKPNSRLTYRTPYENQVPAAKYETNEYVFSIPSSWEINIR